MKTEVTNDRFVISLKLREPKPSKSGKTLLVASTHGVRSSSVKVDGRPVLVNANAFIDVRQPKRPRSSRKPKK
jgi:hypothetical protein